MKKGRYIFLLAAAAAALVLSGCGNGTTDRLSETEVEKVKGFLMSSYYMQRGDAETTAGRATWPAHTDVITFPAAGSSVTKTKPNYPEKGQRTTVTIVPYNSIYKVESITTYPKDDSIINTTEVYYVKDSDSDGKYTIADEICKADGTVDFNYREKFETLYTDSVRYEKVLSNSVTTPSAKYAPFDIDGPLDFPTADTNGNWSPTADSTALYSSLVSYVQEIDKSFLFWTDYTLIIGARYYTEHGDASRPTKTSVTYETVVRRDSSTMSLGDRIEDFFYNLTGTGSSTEIKDSDKITHSVIRYRILPNNQKTVRTKTDIDHVDGTPIVTFTATYEEAADGTVTSTGEPVATYQ